MYYAKKNVTTSVTNPTLKKIDISYREGVGIFVLCVNRNTSLFLPHLVELCFNCQALWLFTIFFVHSFFTNVHTTTHWHGSGVRLYCSKRIPRCSWCLSMLTLDRRRNAKQPPVASFSSPIQTKLKCIHHVQCSTLFDTLLLCRIYI